MARFLGLFVRSAFVASGLPIPLGPATAGILEQQTAVQFGEAKPASAEDFHFQRELASTLTCQVHIDGKLAKDVDVDFDERVLLDFEADPQENVERTAATQFNIVYLSDDPRVFVNAAATPTGTRYFASPRVKERLQRDLGAPTRVHPLAELLSARSMEPGDLVEGADLATAQQWLGSRFAIEEFVLRLRGPGDENLAHFDVLLRARSDLDFDFPSGQTLSFAGARTPPVHTVTTVRLEGTLSVRCADVQWVALELEGPIELGGSWQENGFEVECSGSGNAKLALRWIRPIPTDNADNAPEEPSASADATSDGSDGD